MKKIIVLALITVMAFLITVPCYADSLLDSITEIITEVGGQWVGDAISQSEDGENVDAGSILDSFGDLLGSINSEGLVEIMDAFGNITEQISSDGTDQTADSFYAFGDMLEAIEDGNLLGIISAYNNLAQIGESMNPDTDPEANNSANPNAGRASDSAAAYKGSDLSSMSADKLMELFAAVQRELQIRGLLKDYIGAGTYYVGTDIRKGKFRFTCLQQHEGTYVNVTVLSGSSIINSVSLGVGDIIDMELKNGYALIISNGSGSLVEIEPSWAP